MSLMKKGFSLIEIIFTLMLIAIVTSYTLNKTKNSKLEIAANKIILYLNFTRYIAFLDNKYDPSRSDWYKSRWTLKFKNCNKSIGGIYYTVYSDTNLGGRINKTETLKDPLNNQYLYSNGCKKDNVGDKSKYILLTQQYDVVDVKVSCYKGSGLGYISFGNDGVIYSKLGSNPKVLKSKCTITLIDKHNNKKSIIVEPTGYCYVL